MSDQSDTPISGYWRERGERAVPLENVESIERELAAATREREEARAKIAELVENGRRLMEVAKAAARDADDMADAKYAPLRELVEKFAMEQQAAFGLVSRVREALGDNGRMMQDELIAHCRTLAGMPAEVERLRSALDFYSQPVRYDGPNQRPIPGDPYTTADSAYMNDVCRDGGEIARAALAATEPKP